MPSKGMPSKTMRSIRPGIWKWVAAAAAASIIGIAVKALNFRHWLSSFGHWIVAQGPAAFPIYAAVYVLVAVTLMPAWLMTILAGFLFGLVPGIAVVTVGATAGATASFLIARYVARQRVARAIAGHPRFAALDRAIGEKGWKIVFLLRLSAVVPYVWSNYAYGLTAIRFWPYFFASLFGMIPLNLLYVAGGVAVRRAGGMDATSAPGGAGAAVIAAGVVITVAVTLYVARLTRRAMNAERP